MASGINERIWLEWLVKVRVLIITILLAIELAIVNLTSTNVDRRLFVGVIVGWYGAAALHLAGRIRWPQQWCLQAKAQVCSDLVFATAVIYTTGGIDTSFNFLYPLLIIVAAVLLSETWAYLTASLSFILLGATLELSYFDLIPTYSTTRSDPKSLQAIILINLMAYVALAYLANKLARRIRQADVDLSTKSYELENLQRLHEIIVHSISSGLITTDLEGSIRLANPAARALLGRHDEDLGGAAVQPLFFDPLPAPGAPRREVCAETPDGREKLFGVGCSLAYGSEGSAIGYIYSFTDLTELRNLEDELRQRDRLAAVGRLASGIAHEIRNPLASIAGSVKMLSGLAGLGDDQRALLDIVTRESERLNSILTDFLAYSRDRKFQLERLDLCPLIAETLTLLENRSRQVHVVRQFAASQAFVAGDSDKLRQVFWNLASNAVRAMPDGGTLTVELDAAEDCWRVRVRDTGSGIEPQLLEKIFEPFQSGFEGGTGLGLAIVDRILQAHDANIAVRSEPGEGTEFTILFRRLDEALESRSLAALSALRGEESR